MVCCAPMRATALILAVVLVVGCGKKDNGSEAPAAPSTEAAPAPLKTLAEHEAACDAGNAESCFTAGNAHGLARLGAVKDPVKGLGYLTRACKAGHGQACELAGLAKVAVANLPAALAAKCDSGDAKACSTLGMQYWLGNESITQRDPDKARALLKTGCDAGDAESCMLLGRTWEKAEEPDPTKAVAMYEKACAAGGTTACRLAGKVYFDRKDAKAALLLPKACAGGDMDGCALAGLLYRGGFGVTADPRRSQAYLKKACDGGLKRVCKYVQN